MTAREVAAALGVCRDTVYRMCADGTLRHFRVRNSVRVPASAVETLMNANESEGDGE